VVEASETSLALAEAVASFIIVAEEPAVAGTVGSQFVRMEEETLAIS